MGFRFRLACFFVAALVVVQGLTAALVYQVARQELIGEGQRQLDVATRAFALQLDDISARVATSVQILALDYALRSAIAQRDDATLLSALRNHGRRVGATRMLLLDVEGNVEADTRRQFAAGTRFPYADLARRALEQPAAAVVAWRGQAYWMVVVPVSAPTLVGFIAAAIPVDDALLSRLQRQSALPKRIELATSQGGHWTVIARGTGRDGLTSHLTAHGFLPTRPRLIDVDGREFVAQAIWLNRSRQSAPVAAVLGYSVDEALAPYRPVTVAWAVLSLFGLVVGLAGAWLIARGVARPIEQLAQSARRIEAGEYGLPLAIARRDEIGDLAAAFNHMAQSIREREARILHQAGHDQVTGLTNRVAAEAEIQHSLDSRGDEPAALLMVGLGRVPEIIKTMGHMVCDRVMRDAGGRIRAPAGQGLVARATDTEFSVFLPGATREDAIALAFRLIEALAEPYREADLTLDLAPAAGIALAPRHGTRASDLLRRAEVALLGALGSEEPVTVYNPATDPHRPERLSLMGELREALDRGHLAMHYQPKLHLASGRIRGAEGLVRWQHPQRGAIAPDAFISLAEETGNIRRLTRWALATGIAQLARWNAAGDERRQLRLSVNVSARDLDDDELPRRIAELLAVHQVLPEQLVLEITESAIMGKPEAALAVLRRLADRGIDIAIDDFGVGQSSLAYLRRLPVRELKIDKSFVAQLATMREDQTIVRSIIELGHHLGYRVTAEGVDDVAALDFLASVGCDYAQGYLIARALPESEFERLLVRGIWPGDGGRVADATSGSAAG